MNFLFIMADEHNRAMMGNAGHPLVKTPHLDALADRGTRFTSAYSNCPICVPARASIATGRYNHEICYWDNATAYDGRVSGWGHRLQNAGVDLMVVVIDLGTNFLVGSILIADSICQRADVAV